MHISPLEEYGLRVATQLARSAQLQETVSASKIAESEGISTEYSSKILFLFKKAGIIEATRGAQGGFRLLGDPKDISVKKILSSLQQKKTFEDDFCSHFKGQKADCVHVEECSIRPIWKTLFTYLDGLFSQLTLADLVKPELNTFERASEVSKSIVQSSMSYEGAPL